MKKILKKSIVVLPVLLFLTAYFGIPEKVTLFEGESLDFKWGITATANTSATDSYSCDVKLFNLIPIKTVDVNVVPKTYLIPSGEAIGVKLYTEGVLVVGMSDVCDKNGKVSAPAKDAGIKAGDRILAVNGKSVSGTDDFTEKVNEAEGNITIDVARGDIRFPLRLRAVFSGESESYKIGLWVRDSTAGIGTLTFYNPEDGSFAALGHGICDTDTKDLMVVGRGTVNACKIRGVIKGKTGAPGELTGDFSGCEIGSITANTASGIKGEAESVSKGRQVEISSRFEVKKGPAEIICDVDGNGPRSYEIEITKTMAKSENKSIVLKITDKELLKKTGGIVQGMSGAPLIQNGKLVGAVTHVFVNDPTRGYAIFIENMLEEANKIK